LCLAAQSLAHKGHGTPCLYRYNAAGGARA
jgi:hypothetical protein